MEIRAATFDDRPGLQSLMEASMRALGPGFYTEAETEAAARHLTVPDDGLIEDGTLYVAEIEGRIAGVGGWSSRRKLCTGSLEQEALRDERLDPASDAARVRAFFVAPEFSRRGVARRLYEACAEGARAAGFRGLVLMATLPGVPLYRALGFGDERPTVMELPDGSGLPCVEMRKSLR